MKYFSNVKTLEELKKEYKKMVYQLHPDKGGDAAEFKKMQVEYEEAAKILATGEQNWKRHQKADGTQKTADELVKEAREMADKIEKIITLEGIKIEICGTWLWVSGDTKAVKNELKGAGLHWAGKKLAWYWHADGWVRRSRKEFSLNEIRTMHGSETVKSGEYTKIGVSPVPPTTNHYQEQVLF